MTSKTHACLFITYDVLFDAKINIYIHVSLAHNYETKYGKIDQLECLSGN